MIRTCGKCGGAKPLSEFYPKSPTRRDTTCKDCVKADRRARYAADPAYRERSHAVCKQWHRDHSAEKTAARAAVRLEMIEAYGGVCECCGEAAPAFLTMDHIGGWGSEHRRTVKSATSRLPFMLKKEGWPRNGFRLLCWNCNCSRGIYGHCPHEPGSTDGYPTIHSSRKG